MTTYTIEAIRNGKSQTIATFDTIEEARAELAAIMSRLDISDDDIYIADEEIRQNEIEMLQTIAEDGVDVSERIAKVEALTLPCIATTDYDEVCNLLGDSFTYDSTTVRVQSIDAERQRIGSLIAEARRAAGLSVRDLANLAGVHYSNIAKIENGRYNVSIDVLYKVLAPLGLQVDFAKSE